jgi:hypothetical protein
LPALGNRNYKGGSTDIVDLEEGVAQVGELILLCVCAKLQRCHRLAVAEVIADRYAVTIEHC